MKALKQEFGPGKYRGWKLSYDPEDYTGPNAGVCDWLVQAPGQSLAWCNYLVSCVHLRDAPGVDPAIKKFPNASHEIIILALDPQWMGMEDLTTENFMERRDRARKAKKSWVLRPHNYAGQIESMSDHEAMQVTDALAVEIIKGHLYAEGPLSGVDYWTPWVISMCWSLRQTRSTVEPGEDPMGFGRGKYRLL